MQHTLSTSKHSAIENNNDTTFCKHLKSHLFQSSFPTA